MRWSISPPSAGSLDEILTAFGEMTLEKPDRIREGVKENKETNSDLFFVTLEKTEKGYSPTTLYKDYAISPELFHWESQSMTSQASPTGQRYIHHRQRGSNILLFVRRTGKIGTRTAPYIFPGFADYMSHERERPIAFVWRLVLSEGPRIGPESKPEGRTIPAFMNSPGCDARCRRISSGKPRWQRGSRCALQNLPY